MSTHRIECTVNGELQSMDVPSRRLLADFLRDDLHLTGTKRGCETGICGACSILLDGEVVKSCLMLAVQVQGRAITTIEGLSEGEELHAVRRPAMRLLHTGLHHGLVRPAQEQPSPHHRPGTPRTVRQPVPLHRLYANCGICAPRCPGDESWKLKKH